MRELIDKQNTINIIMGEPTDLHYPSWYAELVKEIQPEAQQKKGKWIRVGGYVTPGGDPVWRCSECGKGQHVWGIEHNSYGADIADHQWVACPNCGIEMEGEQW